MYDNVFVGENANKQPKRILILGESHYKEDGEFDGTASVVKYFAIDSNGKKKDKKFYHYIMRTFGYEITEESSKEFWNKVYCGNYVCELCDKGKDNPAQELVEKNKIEYNDSLFNFINEHEIDIVLCFSRLVYNNLPDFAKGENEEKLFKHRTQYLNKYTYRPDCEHKNCTVKLNKPLIVYGFKHPSRYYSYESYHSALENEKNEIGL